MHIRNARPAPRHILIPTPALEALLESPFIGKGHLVTVLKVARYLWGNVPVEGSVDDFSDVLGIPKRTLQRHIPQVGRSGCWHCIRPHRGYYVLLGFAQTWGEVEEIRAAWASGPPAVAPKMAQPVVVLSSPERDLSSFSSPRREQQHGAFDHGEGGMGGGGEFASEMAQSTPEMARDGSVSPVAADLAALVGEETAARLLREYGEERIERQVEHYRWARRQGKATGPGWLIRAIEADWSLPEDVESRLQFWKRDSSQRYLESAYGELIEY